MIYELEKEQYRPVSSLFKGLDYQLIITAVLEGTSPGRVFVDDPDHPRSCFLSTAEGCFLAGDPDNEVFNIALGKFIKERMTPANNDSKEENELIVTILPNDWTGKFNTVFLTQAPLIIPRRYYECTQLQWKLEIPKGYMICRIDKELLNTPQLSIPDHIESWIDSNWGSLDSFIELGFGFVMVHRNQVVSWSIADCVSGNRCEIGIQTKPEYRRQGLATLTAAATVDFCLQSRFQLVGWHTSEDNIGSIRVAENVGFKRVTNYTWYLFKFK